MILTLKIAKFIGLESALKLANEYGGENVYFHKYEAIARAAGNRVIKKEFNGSNYKELARKFNLSTMILRNVLKEEDSS